MGHCLHCGPEEEDESIDDLNEDRDRCEGRGEVCELANMGIYKQAECYHARMRLVELNYMEGRRGMDE